MIIIIKFQDGNVFLWVSQRFNENEQQGNSNASEWAKFELKKLPEKISRIAWDLNGTHLAISTDDGLVYLFKELDEDSWGLVSMSNTEGAMENVKEEENEK